jgi:hypothetical protein
MSDEIEFAMGSVTGVRDWKVDEYGRLRGISYDAIWRPGENQAKCGSEPADIEESHGCGFWAYYASTGRAHTGQVTGVIEGYGKTTLGSKGFRCEKAKVVALAVDDGWSIPNKRLAQWGDDHADGSIPVGLFGCLGGAVLTIGGTVGFFADSRWQGLLTLLGLVLLYCAGSVIYGVAEGPVKGASVPWDLLRRNYPDIKFYRTKRAMLAKEPLSGPPNVLGPDDPEFWEGRPPVNEFGARPQYTVRYQTDIGGFTAALQGVSWTFANPAIDDEPSSPPVPPLEEEQ